MQKIPTIMPSISTRPQAELGQTLERYKKQRHAFSVILHDGLIFVIGCASFHILVVSHSHYLEHPAFIYL